MNDLARASIYYRAKHRLTQAELAQKCGVDRVTIHNVEKDRHVSPVTEAKIRLVIEEAAK